MNVPQVGVVTKITARVVLEAAAKVTDDDSLKEAAKKYAFDPADLNPIRNFTNMTKHLHSLTLSYDQDIWIGKRSMSFFALSIAGARSDVYHWALMINGTVYHIEIVGGPKAVLDDPTYFRVVISNDDDLKETFEWLSIRSNIDNSIRFKSYEVVRSKSELENFCRAYQNNYTYKIAVKRDDSYKSNCQKFVVDVLAYALDTCKGNAEIIADNTVGNFLFT